MVATIFMKSIIVVVVSSAIQRVREQKSGRYFGARLEVEYGLKGYIRPSPLEISLEDISIDMRKSVNGFLVQNLWPTND